MKRLSTLLALVLLPACGIDTSKLAQQQSTGTSTGASTGTMTEQAERPAGAAGETTVTVHTETDVTVTVGGAGRAPASAATEGTLLRFADGAFGWFFADGSFDHGAALVRGQQAPAFCRFEAPGCEGRCVVDALPAKDALFTNGAAFFRAYETETDLGRTVVASIWRGGRCEAEVKTLQHAYSPTHAWVLDAGDSTVPAEHAR